ncbi:IGR protein motif-domain-containing protein [Biscogniauxia marginata]|nr:IGR protein motif-domain-containing protein [Biscogniauxia marginata]
MVRIKPVLCPRHLRGLLSSSNSNSSRTPQLPRTAPALLQRASPLLFSPFCSPPSTSPPQQAHAHARVHCQQQRLYSSQNRQAVPAPDPTPFVPDVQTFLTLIGRGLGQHAAKFPTWESLFATTSDQLRDLGVEPPRTRRYLLQWRDRFRSGQYGVGGDLRHVVDGRAELRVLETRPGEVESPSASASPPAAATATATEGGGGQGEGGENPPAPPPAVVHRRAKYVVNVPPGKKVKECSLDELSRVRGYKVRGAHTIVGPYALPLKDGQGSTVTVTEGMWEFRRGHKIDGGERRRTEVQYKKRIAERREMRERGEL